MELACVCDREGAEARPPRRCGNTELAILRVGVLGTGTSEESGIVTNVRRAA